MLHNICYLFICNAFKATFFSARCLCHVKSFKLSRAETPGGQLFRRFKYITNKKYYEILTIQKCVGK